MAFILVQLFEIEKKELQGYTFSFEGPIWRRNTSGEVKNQNYIIC